MASYTTSGAEPQSRRGIRQIIRSYFYWDFPRGTVQYDIMVTLILLFIFVGPQIWDFGARPTPMTVVAHPIEVTGSGTHGMLVTVQAADVILPPNPTDHQVKDALKRAIQPVAGDSVFVEGWQTVTNAQGDLEWQVWAHR